MSKSIAKVVAKSIDTLSSWCGTVSALLLVACALDICYEICMRHVFNRPSIWSLNINTYAMIWFAFLAVPYALKQKSHVHVDILVTRLAPEIQETLKAVAYLFIILFCSLFTAYGLSLWWTSIMTDEVDSLILLPMWTVKLAPPLGIFVLGLQAVKMFFESWINLKESTRNASIKKNKIYAILSLFVVLLLCGFFLMKINVILGLVVLLLVLLVMGVPVAFALGCIGIAGFFLLFGGERALINVAAIGYSTLNSFTLVALPLFIFAGQIIQQGGIARDIFEACSTLLERMKGGLGVATVGACAIFAAISGSTVATAATIGLIAIPELLARGYDRRLAYGIVAAGGTLGILIPPSNSMILIGVLTEESVGKLFMAGLIPGIVLAAMLAATVIIMAKRTTSSKQKNLKQQLTIIKRAFWGFMLPVVMLGGMYFGIFTPTEAAAVGTLYSLVICLGSRKLTFKKLPGVLAESTKTIGMLFMIIVGAMIVGNVVTRLQVPQSLTSAILAKDIPGWVFIAAVMGFCIILGMFLECASITLIMIPILYPALSALGYNIMWFAVLFTINMELALLTPPVGLNLYVIQQISGARLEEVIKGVLPFIAVLTIGLILIAIWPSLSLWLPSTMK